MTYEEVKAIRENPTTEACDIKELQKLIDEAIEKQIAKKPIDNSRYHLLAEHDIKAGDCPECGRMVIHSYREYYCGKCGQKIKWEETNK